MPFCLPCATRLKVDLAGLHQDLGDVDLDTVRKRKQRRVHKDRQQCYAALHRGYLEIGLSVDPVARTKQPGTKLLFILPGPGPKRQRDAQRRLVDSRAEDMGHNYFQLTSDVIEWINENHAKQQETMSRMRDADEQDEMSTA